MYGPHSGSGIACSGGGGVFLRQLAVATRRSSAGNRRTGDGNEMHCSSCHDANDLALLKQPPKLTGLFARKTLPSGAPTTDEQVRNTIVSGREIMPPFGSTLDTKQVDELLRYLHTI